MRTAISYRLRDDSFIRLYEQIGLVYNQVTERQQVFDHTGALFLDLIKRKHRTLDDITSSLLKIFCNADHHQLRSDFHRVACLLEQSGFVEIVGHGNKPDASETPMCFNRPRVTSDCGVIETSRFLKAHFARHPRVFYFHYSITERCNAKCIHCYADCPPDQPLSHSRCLEIIDELGQIGTLHITFTGGEALSHPHLSDLISRAIKNDLVVTFISNLTLLTDELCAIIKASNLRLVQTSLYSMIPDVHDSITMVKGSWAKTVAAIDRLMSAGVRVEINCPILTSNVDSFQTVMSYGCANNIPVRYDLKLIPSETGNWANLVYRLSGRDLERVMKTIISSMPNHQEVLTNTQSERRPIENCGIGTYKLSMKSSGALSPCPGFGRDIGTTASHTIEHVWKNSKYLLELRRMERSKAYPQCVTCHSSNYCAFCPAKFMNEANWGWDSL